MTPLAELLERVKAATGPDRELDGRLYVAMSGGDLTDSDHFGWVKGPHDIGEAPPLTASVDAALKLVERVLPGAEFEITNLYGVPMATLPMNMSLTVDQETARLEGGTLPLAVIAALLQALIARLAPADVGDFKLKTEGK